MWTCPAHGGEGSSGCVDLPRTWWRGELRLCGPALYMVERGARVVWTCPARGREGSSGCVDLPCTWWRSPPGVYTASPRTAPFPCLGLIQSLPVFKPIILSTRSGPVSQWVRHACRHSLNTLRHVAYYDAVRTQIDPQHVTQSARLCSRQMRRALAGLYSYIRCHGNAAPIGLTKAPSA